MFKEIQNYNYTHATNFNFKALCELIVKQHYDLAAEQIKALAVEVDTDALPFDAQCYVRNIIVSNGNYWLGLLNWDKGATTRIHGHPEQTFMYVIKGQLSCKNFNKNPLIEVSSSEVKGGEYQHSSGIMGKMDNYIHQISAKQPSLSLHFYSDDPSKGEVFDF